MFVLSRLKFALDPMVPWNKNPPLEKFITKTQYENNNNWDITMLKHPMFQSGVDKIQNRKKSFKILHIYI